MGNICRAEKSEDRIVYRLGTLEKTICFFAVYLKK